MSSVDFVRGLIVDAIYIADEARRWELRTTLTAVGLNLERDASRDGVALLYHVLAT